VCIYACVYVCMYMWVHPPLLHTFYISFFYVLLSLLSTFSNFLPFTSITTSLPTKRFLPTPISPYLILPHHIVCPLPLFFFSHLSHSFLTTLFLHIFRYLILRSCLLELMNKEIILPNVDISKTCPSSVSGPQTNGRSKARFLFLFFLLILCVHSTLLSMNFTLIIILNIWLKLEFSLSMI
jgi:hypothetical protein